MTPEPDHRTQSAGLKYFRHRHRLRKNRAFKTILDQGKTYPGQTVILVCLPNPEKDGITQAGFIASRRIGKAVKRNRVRRWMRENYRELRPHLKTAWWLVWIARRKALKLGCSEVREEMKRLTKQAGLWPKPRKRLAQKDGI